MYIYGASPWILIKKHFKCYNWSRLGPLWVSWGNAWRSADGSKGGNPFFKAIIFITTYYIYYIYNRLLMCYIGSCNYCSIAALPDWVVRCYIEGLITTSSFQGCNPYHQRCGHSRASVRCLYWLPTDKPGTYYFLCLPTKKIKTIEVDGIRTYDCSFW